MSRARGGLSRSLGSVIRSTWRSATSDEAKTFQDPKWGGHHIPLVGCRLFLAATHKKKEGRLGEGNRKSSLRRKLNDDEARAVRLRDVNPELN